MIYNQLIGGEQVIDDAGEVDASALIELMERAGFEPRSYSGRAMYGKDCIGIVTDRPGAVCLDIVSEWANMVNGDGNGTLYTRMEELQLLVGVLRNPHEDSMGRDAIIYWPDLPWPEDMIEKEVPFDVAPRDVETADE